MKRITPSILGMLACHCIVNGVTTQDAKFGQEYDAICSLYLAETVDDRGAPTMGVFTSKPLPVGQLIGFPDIVIPLIDIPLHNSPTHENEQEFWWLWNDLVWDPADVGGAHEGMDVKSAAVGLGSLTRGDPKKANAIMLQSQFDNSGFDRTRDPGAGAISYYHDAKMISIDSVEAGSELFFHQGFHWYLDPHDQESALLETLPVEEPHVQDFWARHAELGQKNEDALTGELRTKLWDLLREFPLEGKAKRLLPCSWTDSYGLDNKKTINGKRTPEWLAENGICLDHLRQGPSDIPQAGRGAFATRPLPVGTVISPAPLVHVLDKKSLNMYAPHVDENFMYTMSDEVINKQLLINYCFGHPESTKLLCPIGTGTAFVNHSPAPNAAIRWSTHKSSALHNEEWLNMTVEQMGTNMDIGLMIEYYALRDINPDEEITINYGLDWVKSWDQHVAEWLPPAAEEDYISAVSMNDDLDNWLIKTVAEQQEIPYPTSVLTSCVYDHIGADGVHDESGVYADPAEFDVIVKRWEPLDEDKLDFMFLRPCVILSRHAVNDEKVHKEDEVIYEYVVQILNNDQIHDEQQIPDYEVLIVEGFPRYSISFTDFAYSSDMHLRNSFRKEMTMPDGIFPNSWRNLKR